MSKVETETLKTLLNIMTKKTIENYCVNESQ